MRSVLLGLTSIAIFDSTVFARPDPDHIRMRGPVERIAVVPRHMWRAVADDGGLQ